MKETTRILAILSIFGAALSATAQETAEWKSLFDGNTLNGESGYFADREEEPSDDDEYEYYDWYALLLRFLTPRDVKSICCVCCLCVCVRCAC